MLNDTKEINMGRAHENEVRISDISVSRCHAKIFYVKNLIRLKLLEKWEYLYQG